jgi:hypothetical protein
LQAETNSSGPPAWTHLPGPCFHWGVPTFAFENEPFFGQDRIDLLIRRMQDKGLTRRKNLNAES